MSRHNDELGDRMKMYESATETTVMRGVPILARLDGRAFHTFCRGLKKPYDKGFCDLMISTAKFLAQEFDADLVYTQSDEITLFWRNECVEQEKRFFGGRIQKMCSTIAATASVEFNAHLAEFLPSEKTKMAPTFDCRVWVVPNLKEAKNVFLWREIDASKNSIASAGQAYFSHKELYCLNSKQIQDKLWKEKQINWNDYPAFFKRGTYIARRLVGKPLTIEELEKLPPKHNARKDPSKLVVRRVFVELDIPRLGSLSNAEDVLFQGAEPIIRERGEQK